MVTLREWFDEFGEATGETVQTIVFGWRSGWGDYNAHRWPVLPSGVTSFDVIGALILDNEFDDGFGANETPNLCAWSASYVLFNDNYDGAESLQWVPRDPTEHEPIRPGGG